MFSHQRVSLILILSILFTLSIHAYGLEKIFTWNTPIFKNSSDLEVKYIEIISAVDSNQKAEALFQSSKDKPALHNLDSINLAGNIIFGYTSDNTKSKTGVSIIVKASDSGANYTLTGQMQYDNLDDDRIDWKNISSKISSNSEIDLYFKSEKLWFELSITFDTPDSDVANSITYKFRTVLIARTENRKLLLF